MAATIAAGSATNSPARSADRLLRSRRAIADHPGRSAGSQLALPVVGSVDRLDAGQLRSVVLGYRDALRAHQEMLNRLNVYPVPDGDTGTNMALTLESVVREAAEAASEAAKDGGGLLEVLEAADAAAQDSLARTPELLPVLAEAGVVDAGAAGFVLLLDVLLNITDGRPLREPEEGGPAP